MAFEGCTSLSNITIPDSVTKIGEKAFAKCNIKNLSHKCLTIRNGVAIKNGEAIYIAVQDKAVDIPEGVTKISAEMFEDEW